MPNMQHLCGGGGGAKRKYLVETCPIVTYSAASFIRNGAVSKNGHSGGKPMSKLKFEMNVGCI